ncbi:hypothetical protein QL995_01915 [Pseudoalteromonas sp. APC 3358]|nr:hypothetical protein [Pseudoalteromonas sp. APC 3358]MDN3381435.1 hypothetical protein [Pseudoalteromonas sp. APC 3358]
MARLGREEFVFFLPNKNSKVRKIAERLRQTVESINT